MQKKDMNFLQASNKYNLPLIGDVDKDKVPNIFDCKPYDKNRDGALGRVINIVSGGRFGQTRKEYDAEKVDRASKLEQENKNRLEMINKKNELIKTKLKTQKLMAKQQQLLYLQSLGPHPPNPTQMLFNTVFGIPTSKQKGVPFGKPGYEIVYSPKLPKGYHWKKISKKEKKQGQQTGSVNNIEHKFMNYPEAHHFQQQMKQMYGYLPEIFRVTDPYSGMMFFVVVEPMGLERI